MQSAAKPRDHADLGGMKRILQYKDETHVPGHKLKKVSFLS